MNRKITALAAALVLLIAACTTTMAAEERGVDTATLAPQPICDMPVDLSDVPEEDLRECTALPASGRNAYARAVPRPQARILDMWGNVLSDDFFFYRNTLTDAGQQAYDDFYWGLRNQADSIQLSVGVAAGDLQLLTMCVQYDHPELIWFTGSTMYYTNSQGAVTSIEPEYSELAGDDAQTAFQNAANPLINFAGQYNGTPDRMKAIHDWLIANVDYVSGSPHNQVAYSALVNRKTV